MKKLPIGIQTFEKIILGNYLYMDKTELIHSLISSGTVYFLARPRRFGKSLLISTLQAVFEGKRALFKGLAIDRLDYDWAVWPVIRIDFSGINRDTPESFLISLRKNLIQEAERYSIGIDQNDQVSDMFKSLIEKNLPATGSRGSIG